jgi:hypothetical protein
VYAAPTIAIEAVRSAIDDQYEAAICSKKVFEEQKISKFQFFSEVNFGKFAFGKVYFSGS